MFKLVLSLFRCVWFVDVCVLWYSGSEVRTLEFGDEKMVLNAIVGVTVHERNDDGFTRYIRPSMHLRVITKKLTGLGRNQKQHRKHDCWSSSTMGRRVSKLLEARYEKALR